MIAKPLNDTNQVILTRKHIALFGELFRNDFSSQLVSKETQRIVDRQDEIDAYIKKAAKQFPIKKINKVDLAILRLAIYEIFFKKTKKEIKDKKKIIINEAIELAKRFGTNTSPAFVNGVLDTILHNE